MSIKELNRWVVIETSVITWRELEFLRRLKAALTCQVITLLRVDTVRTSRIIGVRLIRHCRRLWAMMSIMPHQNPWDRKKALRISSLTRAWLRGMQERPSGLRLCPWLQTSRKWASWLVLTQNSNWRPPQEWTVSKLHSSRTRNSSYSLQCSAKRWTRCSLRGWGPIMVQVCTARLEATWRAIRIHNCHILLTQGSLQRSQTIITITDLLGKTFNSNF